MAGSIPVQSNKLMKLINIIKSLFCTPTSLEQKIKPLKGLRLEEYNLLNQIYRTEQRLDILRASVPKDRTCCDGCWLAACCPEFDILLKKQERRKARLIQIENKLNANKFIY